MWEDVKGGNDTGSTVLVCLGDSRLLVTCMSTGSPLLSLLGPFTGVLCTDLASRPTASFDASDACRSHWLSSVCEQKLCVLPRQAVLKRTHPSQ